uniref:Chromosome 9 open reading frame 16 n=1 Tax=Neogobius melanostomus TaxID=47308 RepID=A0A8C6SVY9_9GOBI
MSAGGPNGDPNMSAEDSIIDDDDEFEDEEYAAVNSMLDQINSYLDDLEEKNDALNGKLHELLESNRQARLEFRAQHQSSPPPDMSDPTSPKQEDKDDCKESQSPPKDTNED